MKLLMADIYLLIDNPWDATLLYAQVEQAAIEQPVGHEARFKKAKLAYYIGQFGWAQAQLNILKASTSKLIANDALELSMFIAENYNLDTTETTMQTFARADFLIFSKQYDKALLTLDSVQKLYAGSSLADDILFRKGNIYEETGNLNEAAKSYDKIVSDYFFDVLADNALFRYAIVQDKLQNFDKADDAYFKLVSEFPGSIYTNEARNKLRTRRDVQPIDDEKTFWKPNF
jgi:TolA-binding protein